MVYRIILLYFNNIAEDHSYKVGYKILKPKHLLAIFFKIPLFLPFCVIVFIGKRESL